MGRKAAFHIYASDPFEEMLARYLADFDINLGFEVITSQAQRT